MANRKKITDEQLFTLLELYFEYAEKYCFGHVSIPGFGKYVRANGYPDVKDYLLRRNSSIKSRLLEHESTSHHNDECINTSSAIVYKTLDIDSFLLKNPSEYQLRKAIFDREKYYEAVALSCNKKLKTFNASQKRINELEAELEEAHTKNKVLSEKYSALNKDNKELRHKIDSLKSFVEANVLPEIAVGLLSEVKIVKNAPAPEHIGDKAVKDNLLTPASEMKFKNNVVIELADLFDK